MLLRCAIVPAASLAQSLAAIRDLPVARAMLRDRLLTLGPGGFACAVEPLLERAAGGAERERGALVPLASWVAHASAAGEGEVLLAIGAAADPTSLPLTRSVFGEPCPKRAMPPRARLGDIGIAVYANLSSMPPHRHAGESAKAWRAHWAMLAHSPGMRAFCMRSLRERARRHHDPVFIGRLLDQSWISVKDVVVIASRRPTTAAIVFAVATRDRWLSLAPVRHAVALNPFTPPPLAPVLRLVHGGRKALAVTAGP